MMRQRLRKGGGVPGEDLDSPMVYRYILKVTEKFSCLNQPFYVYVCSVA